MSLVRNRTAAQEVIVSALRERFGGTLGGDVSDKHRDRKVMAWSHHEKKTEWQVLE